MSLNFLPGRPNETIQTTCQATWQNHVILAYCSGNNLILLSNAYTRLQTIYINSDCVAVDINSRNGFIALAYANKVNIYKPIHQVMRNPKWVLCCEIMHDESDVNCIKWGSQEEIIVGSNYLSFWKINDEFGIYKPVLLWNKRQPKPVYICTISDDSQFVASVGKFDKTVKFWRKNTISGEQVLFHLTLLPHTDFVTFLKWKQLDADKSHSKDNGSSISRNGSFKSIGGRSNISSFEDPSLTQTLYTLSTDKKLQVWSCHDINSEKTVQNWGTIQLKDEQRFVFIADSTTLSKILKEDIFEKHNIVGIPDLLFIVSYNGNCEVISLENLSLNPPKPMSKKILFNKPLSKSFLITEPKFVYFSDAQAYISEDTKGMLSIVIHDLGGFVQHCNVDVDSLVKDSSNEIVHNNYMFTGHNKSIQRLIRSSDGEAMLTISRFSENCVWCPLKISNGSTLWLKNIISTEVPIVHAVVHEKGNLVILLLENQKVQAWNCPNTYINREEKKAAIIAEFNLSETDEEFGHIATMFNTPEPKHNHNRHYIAIIYDNGKTRSFEVSSEGKIIEVSSDSLAVSDITVQDISIIDPVHSKFVSDRPLLSLISDSGVTRIYKANVNSSFKKITWIKSNEINTGIQNAKQVRGSSTGKLGVMDSSGKRFSLWDLNRGVLEYEEEFEDDIEDIDWTSNEYGQSIVSIGFTGFVLLYTQVRYDYTNNIPSYLPVEKIDITEHTAHDIGDSIWLNDATFVVASGNQLYIKDKSLDLSDEFVSRSIGSRKILSNDILHLNSVLNGPLPVYHPQFLIQSLYCNKLNLVKELVLRLFLEVRKINLNEYDISSLPSDLNVEREKFLVKSDKDYKIEIFPDPYPSFNKSVVESLIDLLTKTSLPYLTRHQQLTLITVIEAVQDLSENKDILDYNGLLFLLGVRLFHAHKPAQRGLTMRDVSWALHSDSKVLLLTSLDGRIGSWQSAKDHKISFWVTENDLIRKIEQIAKFEFSDGDTRDPSKCAIYYLALKKKQVLISLWKLSVGHPEQQKMIKFLNHDFTEERWRTAALKNAFALLSKHRYMDAACFFLLAGSLTDAMNVLYKQVNDIDLAITVCRLYEGDNGPILGDFLKRVFLPEAILQDDRWMTSFIYWKLRKSEVAIKALVTAPFELEDNRDLVKKVQCVNKSFLVEDPALIIMYERLRRKNIKYFIGAQEIENKIEANLIVRVCDIYRRMGCDFLALSLVTNWKFMMPVKNPKIHYTQDSQKENFGINTMASEPTTTNRMRPSLFDKFNDDSSNFKQYKNTLPQTNATKNMLDDFESSRNESGIANMLDDFTNSKPTPQSKNLLDSFTVPSPAPQAKSLRDDFTSPTPIAKPKSLLDDFVTPTQVLEPKNVLDSFSASNKTSSVTSESKSHGPSKPTKPKNLLDDFM
ncbi:hypothetical protein TPHA_0B03980 [Tetrapisispora phaffii CBS 4417]|uniref:RAVE complex protein Rav1 C-terminal domain-containing protein n=1 Tax=Tetrapisispora phaffii (strain ATCC 24235 / CBS 4417 / NBRC 1672 / NRRL Y-8282 / UCD 70-5) TaxID=1071381 RepID=G8BPY9_TETPH|nr:hypothetical protein TPHA_0B03980 [Tetrapisispora phaffii CBS 4417]CCE62070.1 hypothetical protein TPHA_0B03980 [Tetrapisispora phaffii CBS 4417]